MTVIENIRDEPAADPAKTFRVGESLPKALTATELRLALGLSETTFFRLQRAGEFTPFLLARPMGRKKYSGEKAQAFLNGRK